MENDKKTIVKETISDGVRIIEYSDGSTTFKPIDMIPKKPLIDTRTWWQKFKDWLTDHEVTPYVKIRDLADPFGDRRKNLDDIDVGSDGKNAAEIGIKIKL